MEYAINYVGDLYLKEVHHIEVSFGGNSYNVIFGMYVNGGFFSIPNWNCGGELASFYDVFWNTGSLYRALKNKKAAETIAQAICDYYKELKCEEN